MYILMYVVLVLVWVVLDRQARRHSFQICFQYDRLGWPMPVRQPGLPILEAWLNILLGVLLTVIGVWWVRAYITLAGKAYVESGLTLYDLAAVVLAGGVVMLMLGIDALRENWRSKGQPFTKALKL